MIKDEAIAEQVSNLMLKYGARLDASVALVKEHCTKEELQSYRRAVGHIMGAMLLEIINPLYPEHPTLRPTALD